MKGSVLVCGRAPGGYYEEWRRGDRGVYEDLGRGVEGVQTIFVWLFVTKTRGIGSPGTEVEFSHIYE